MVSVSRAELGERPELLARATLRQQIAAVLRRGMRTTASLAQELDAKQPSVERTIERMRRDEQVIRVGDTKPAQWGLAAR